MKRKLTLFPDTFLWIKGDTGLLYNTETFASEKFSIGNRIASLCDSLINIDNLYSVNYDDEQEDIQTNNFFQMISDKKFGCITELESPVISLPPMLNIQHDVERICNDPDRDIGENVLEYLSTITIYLGGHCKAKSYYKQIIYPICSEAIIDCNEMLNFFDKVESIYLQRINIVLSDINHSYIDNIIQMCFGLKDRIIFYVHRDELKKDSNFVSVLLDKGYAVRLICEYDSAATDEDNRFLISDFFNANDPHFGYNFLVKSSFEFNFWETLIIKYGIIKYEFIPVYDSNESFFAENVLLTENELLQSKLSKRGIFAHMTINANVFGTLTILPDKRVYSNVTSPALGMMDDSIYELIIKELNCNYAWRRVRSYGKCKQCIYQWLCPSPSAYEIVSNIKCICV